MLSRRDKPFFELVKEDESSKPHFVIVDSGVGKTVFSLCKEESISKSEIDV